MEKDQFFRFLQFNYINLFAAILRRYRMHTLPTSARYFAKILSLLRTKLRFHYIIPIEELKHE